MNNSILKNKNSCFCFLSDNNDFKIQKTEKLNPWITNFILTKNGTTL